MNGRSTIAAACMILSLQPRTISTHAVYLSPRFNSGKRNNPTSALMMASRCKVGNSWSDVNDRQFRLPTSLSQTGSCSVEVNHLSCTSISLKLRLSKSLASNLEPNVRSKKIGGHLGSPEIVNNLFDFVNVNAVVVR